MTKWFCPYCWYELKEEDNVCSNCGADLSRFSILSYDEKLILGLKSPITQNRMFVIYVLGKKKFLWQFPSYAKCFRRKKIRMNL
jgi:predicted amidophosphoribosyltransferase